jgi:putative endonuclease
VDLTRPQGGYLLSLVVHRPVAVPAERVYTPASSMPEVVRVHPKDVLGRHGEELAAQFLEQAGFLILDRNYRCSGGELDIVAADQRVLVACEVKTRSSLTYGTPIEAITAEKLRRLRRLAVRWVLAHRLLFDAVRVDVIGVLKTESGEFTIEHVRGVG